MNFMRTELAIRLGIKFKEPKIGDAGYDLHACFPEDEIYIYQCQRPVIIPTGICVHINYPHYVGLLSLRSSSGMQGLCIPNGTGIIDSSYTGQINLILSNISNNERVVIKRGQRIAQLVLVQNATPRLREVVELPTTTRGSNGFGSTGHGF